MNSAVIVAGGTGFRFGGDIPKQFIKIDDQEILSYSVNTFLDHPQIDEVIIVCHSDWKEHVITNYPNCIVVKGGQRRQDSSMKGVSVVSDESEYVLIHDAVRPFVSKKIISDCLSALANSDGSAPIMNVSNSLIQLEKEKATYVDRSQIREVQTPQCFRKELISEALSSDIAGTDDIGIVLRLFPKSKLSFIPGNRDNFKITTERDLQVAIQIFDSLQV
jgi:2-C-methyl-D-erythritol 4-phosphate cytidylyltransferase